jgi:hypothetical protein
MKHTDTTFYVAGNFCSFECAAAFSFGSNEFSQNSWESYALLNTMARMLDFDTRQPVQIAPSRLSLEMFGGGMSIEKFREGNTLTRVLPFKMVFNVHATEEIVKIEPDKPAFLPIDVSRLTKAKANIFRASGLKESINSKMKLDSPQA